jgi:methyl-accepting chemotaxis protein
MLTPLPITPASNPAAGLTSIKARILGILAFGYLLLLVLVQFTAVATHRHVEQASGSLFPAALRLQEAEASFEHLQKRYKDAVLLEDPEALEAAERDAGAVADALAAAHSLVADSPDLEPRAADLVEKFGGIRIRCHETYAAMLADKGAISEDVQQQAASLAHDDSDLSASMIALDRSIAMRFRDQLGLIDQWSRRSRAAGWLMLVMALIGCLGAWAVLEFQVFHPLSRLARRMRDIAEGDGDLTDRVEVNGRNELDEVGLWFNVFIERVEQIVIRVTQSARSLADSARTLAETARETARETALQQEQCMRITSSMSEISTAVQEISKTTQLAAHDAREAERNAHHGGQTIHATVDTIQQLLGANQSTAARIAELGAASEAIGKIVQVIDDIANQTSLLALNASIEAARAGEHGRGFAVVAGEVRRLAVRTSKATSKIDQTVRAIQDGTTEVIEAMRSSMHHVEIGVASARSAGDALASIIRGSEAMQLMVTQIASSSSEQSVATRSVNDNLNEIADIGVRTTCSSARAVDACDRLATLAGDLNQLVGAFKVRGELPTSKPRRVLSFASTGAGPRVA